MRFRRQLYNHYSPILFIINFNDFTLIFNTFRKFLNFSPKVQYYSSLVCRYSISIHRFHSPRRKKPNVEKRRNAKVLLTHDKWECKFWTSWEETDVTPIWLAEMLNSMCLYTYLSNSDDFPSLHPPYEKNVKNWIFHLNFWHESKNKRSSIWILPLSMRNFFKNL